MGNKESVQISGGKGPSGLRKRYPYGGSSGCDPYGLSH